MFAQIGLSKSGQRTASFVFGYTAPVTGKSRQMGLGALRPGCGIEEERAKLGTILKLVEQARTDLAGGLDPKDARDRRVIAELAAQATLDSAIDGFVADRLGHATDTYRERWAQDLRLHCPDLLAMPLSMVDRRAIAAALRPVWQSIPVTAGHLRRRLYALFEYARGHGWVAETIKNPAQWIGGLDALLSPVQTAVVPHKALPYAEVPSFMRELAERDGAVTAWAIRWLVLTCVRCTEGAHARWDEIDLANRLWVVPASRMKRKTAHHEGTAVIGRYRPAPRPAPWHVARRPAFAVPVSGTRQQAGHRHRGGRDDEPGASRWHHRARLPQFLPRLGIRLHRFRQPDRRDGAGASDRQQDRALVSQDEATRETPAFDGGVGAILLSRAPG